MVVAYSAVRSESPAGSYEVPSAGETSGAVSGPYADPASVPEDVQERLLYQGGDTSKDPTLRAGCAECKVVFSTNRAFDAHVRARGHIDPIDAGLAWNSRGYFQFPTRTVVDSNIVRINRAQHPSGGSREESQGASPAYSDAIDRAAVGRVVGDSTAEHHPVVYGDPSHMSMT